MNLLFRRQLHGHTTGMDFFQKVDNFFTEVLLFWTMAHFLLLFFHKLTTNTYFALFVILTLKGCITILED